MLSYGGRKWVGARGTGGGRPTTARARRARRPPLRSPARTGGQCCWSSERPARCWPSRPASGGGSPAPRCTGRRARPRATSGSRSAASVISRPSSGGGAPTTTSPCSRRPTPASPATSPIAGSPTPASPPTFSRRNGRFVVRTDGPDGTLAGLRHQVHVRHVAAPAVPHRALRRSPAGAQHRLGHADRRRRADSAGFTSTPGRTSPTGTSCTGRASARTGTTCAPSATRPASGRTTTPRPGASRTIYAEVNVACEACHGPGSNHVAWARQERDGRRLDDVTKGLAVALDDRRGVTWTISAETGNAQRSPPRGRAGSRSRSCGRCHARRGQFSEDGGHGRPLGDTHRVALLEDRLYYPDGQIRDEVYEYGSFLQSKMFHQGRDVLRLPRPAQRQAPRARRARSASAATRPRSTRRRRITSTRRARAAPTASAATCPPPPTWWSTRATTTASASRVRTSRSSSACRTRAPDATRTGRPSGRPSKVEAWYGRAPRGYQRYAEAFAAAARRGARAGGSAAGRGPRRRSASHRAGERARASRRHRGRPRPRRRPRGREGPRPARAARGGRARSRASSPARRVELLAPLLDDPVRAVRMEAARALAGRPAGASDRRAADGARPGPRRVRRRPSASMPIARSRT